MPDFRKIVRERMATLDLEATTEREISGATHCYAHFIKADAG